MENNSECVCDIPQITVWPCCALIQVAGLTAFDNVSLACQQIVTLQHNNNLGFNNKNKNMASQKKGNKSVWTESAVIS